MSNSLPEHVRRAIYGEQTAEEKRQAYEGSLANWWGEYAARKNDEEEEHVADTLLYDERCHLPRSVPKPDVLQQRESRRDTPTGAQAKEADNAAEKKLAGSPQQ
eukprot:CAMPEP_0119378386 /NCGR_PEP_ID=MMETSP1334-20130426/48102_1 /TAXON_ID=127549 /ORGANISM="Calcidiscus leptoporus, Strain RCC1130" /LENGTH=103 /DNA_ID=CAMNT_0007397571 /DNA_START=210 /DNA_END=521 /DNA_ORIENTATION=+